MIEPSFRLINPQANRSFIFKWEPFDLTTRWHYHPELELIYFIKGTTSAVIGDSFKEFSEGDLVLLGANFPHVLQECLEHKKNFPGEEPFGLIIQFTEQFLGGEFLQKPEMASLQQMIRKSQRGLHFRSSIVQIVEPALLAMHLEEDKWKLVSLLGVLLKLAETNECDYLMPRDYSYDHTQDEERMRKVYQFVYCSFREKISLEQVAAVANMTETSFCRYFKSRTLKNFTFFLNEVRISYACKLLKDRKNSVSNVCFESGFSSPSYFTRQFKSIMKMSPVQYQKRV